MKLLDAIRKEIKFYSKQKNGISLRKFQDWLRHYSSKTTERYTHLDSNTKINSASIIEKALIFNTNIDIKTNKKIY